MAVPVGGIRGDRSEWPSVQGDSPCNDCDDRGESVGRLECAGRRSVATLLRGRKHRHKWPIRRTARTARAFGSGMAQESPVPVQPLRRRNNPIDPDSPNTLARPHRANAARQEADLGYSPLLRQENANDPFFLDSHETAIYIFSVETEGIGSLVLFPPAMRPRRRNNACEACVLKCVLRRSSRSLGATKPGVPRDRSWRMRQAVAAWAWGEWLLS